MSETTTPEGTQDISVPLSAIMTNMLGLSLALLIVPLVVFVLIWGQGVLLAAGGRLDFIAWIIVFTVLHELVHGATWKVFGKVSWADIEFGVKWKYLAPYAHSKAPIVARAYRAGVVAPLIVVGLLPYAVALVIGDGLLALLGAVMISGAVGDLTVLWVMRSVDDDAQVLDHPENAGCLVLPTS